MQFAKQKSVNVKVRLNEDLKQHSVLQSFELRDNQNMEAKMQDIDSNISALA